MSFISHNCAITSQITSAQDTITGLTIRIRGLEDLLDNPNLPENKRTQIQSELIEIKKLLDKNKEILSTLHKENTKSFIAVACLAFLCCVIYIVYYMVNER